MTDHSAQIDVTCLGTGTSHGVPMIGCDCEVCTSTDPHDQRSRPAITVTWSASASWQACTVLIDTPPELRLQCVANRVRNVNAVLYTHHHADHVAGLDDLRRFNWINQSELDCFGLPATLDRVRNMFGYAFEDDPEYPSHKPSLRLQPLDDAPFSIRGREILPIPLMHGPLPVLGFRIGRFAYCTDCNYIPESSMNRLRNLDVLILDALRYKPHPTHFNLDQAVEAAGRIGARQTYFTHIAHELMHERVNESLPPAIQLAHDGLRLTIDDSQ